MISGLVGWVDTNRLVTDLLEPVRQGDAVDHDSHFRSVIDSDKRATRTRGPCRAIKLVTSLSATLGARVYVLFSNGSNRSHSATPFRLSYTIGARQMQGPKANRIHRKPNPR